MRNQLSKIIYLAIALTMYGCCQVDECEDPIGFIKIRLMRNGQNALYGPDAFLTKGSIHLTTPSGFSGYEDYIEYDDANESFGIYIDENTPSFLKLSSIRTDTFTITTDFIEPTKSCSCGDYKITSVSRNGVVICTGLCEDVIDIEI